MAYADKPEGHYTIYALGTLHLTESHFGDHIASPDVVVDNAAHKIRLYYHGLTPDEKVQHTRVALSDDGIHFTAQSEPVARGSAYWRVFHYEGWWYALAMPGKLFRSRDGLTAWEAGQQLFPISPVQVHNAVLVRGNTLHVFFTRAGDTPERILYAAVKLGADWNAWKPGEAQECLKPERDWEGTKLPLAAGRIGEAKEPIHALRDPALLENEGKLYLFYAIAGESGIAGAEVRLIRTK